MRYSPRLRSFVEANRPGAMTWKTEELVDIAREAGLTVEEAGPWYKIEIPGSKLTTRVLRQRKDLYIPWVEVLPSSGVTELVFEPAMGGYLHVATPLRHKLGKAVFAQAGIDPFSVELPEPVIKLAHPGFAWQYAFEFEVEELHQQLHISLGLAIP